MISSQAIQKITTLVGRYPEKSSAILPALMMVQEENNNQLTNGNIQELSEILDVPVGTLRGVATFYSLLHLNRPMGRYHLQVDMSISALLMGAEAILAHLEKNLGIKDGQTTPDERFALSTVEDLASGGTCPIVRVNSVYYENMTREKIDKLIDSLKKDVMPPREAVHHFGTTCNVLLKRRGVESASHIEIYKNGGGYRALAKAYQMNPQAIVAAIKDSGIRGRGGAGFPTGVKWQAIQRDGKKPVYLICNADEGEPGSFKDRQIMEYDPHLLVEGMAIAAYAIGAKLGFIYIRGEFGWIADILEAAIDDARTDGQLREFDIIVHRGGGSYVCGEETALIESIEGRRGHPRRKPPLPIVAGLYQCPTLVNNVETLASVPYIVEHGPDAFKKWGFADNYGFKLFSISGHVNKPGVYEYPIGVAFTELLNAAGGVKGRLKAAVVGGLSTPILTAAELGDLNMDYDSCRRHGTSLGTRGIIVINETTSIVPLAFRTATFFSHESCGKCTPCREGTYFITQILEKILAGSGSEKDIQTISRLADGMQGLTRCPVGNAFSGSIGSMIEKFRGEFEAFVK